MLKRFYRRHQAGLTIAFSWACLALLVAIPQDRALTLMVARLFATAIVKSGHGWIPVMAGAMVAALAATNRRLKLLGQGWLEWSLFKSKANIALLPLTVRYWWLPYLALLAVCVPLMAWMEEWIFRYLIHGGWAGVLWGGFFFGAIHLAAGVTVRMSLCLTGHGLVLVALFGLTGLFGVFLVHAAYNLIVIGLVVFEVKLRQPLGLWLKGHRRLRFHLPTVTDWLLKPSQWYA